jgi:peptide/nickel transport system permease protein
LPTGSSLRLVWGASHHWGEGSVSDDDGAATSPTSGTEPGARPHDALTEHTLRWAPGIGALAVVIGLVFAPLIAKTVRAAVLSERQLDYVTAAHLRKDSRRYILFAEILPNVSGVIIVEFTVRLGYAIFTVLALSFLGFGIDPGIPDWGQAIAQHYGFLAGDIWWPVLFPALAIASLVVAVNLFADAISQAFE